MLMHAVNALPNKREFLWSWYSADFFSSSSFCFLRELNSQLDDLTFGLQWSTEQGLPDSDWDIVIESIYLSLTQCLSVKHHTTTVLLHPQILNTDPGSASVRSVCRASLNHRKSCGKKQQKSFHKMLQTSRNAAQFSRVSNKTENGLH